MQVDAAGPGQEEQAQSRAKASDLDYAKGKWNKKRGIWEKLVSFGGSSNDAAITRDRE